MTAKIGTSATKRTRIHRDLDVVGLESEKEERRIEQQKQNARLTTVKALTDENKEDIDLWRLSLSGVY